MSDQRGMALIELMVAMVMVVALMGATFSALESATNTQMRDQVFADEVTSAQAAVGRLLHDLRQATSIVNAQANRIEFLMPGTQVVNGASQQVTLDVLYNCAAADTRTGYTRCARVQAVSGTTLPAIGATAGSGDIEHVTNGSVGSYCNSAGTAQAGSVFFYGNPNITNPDVSPPSCDENYENIVAQRPNYVQVLIRVPASGAMASGGLRHTTVLSGGAFLRNWNLGA